MSSHHRLLPSRRKYELSDFGEPIEELRPPSAWDRTKDFLIATSVGQYILRQTYEVLRTIEQTAKWRCSVSTDEPASKLVRPLPWILFLPALVVLRVVHNGLQLLCRLRGQPIIKAEDIVRNMQRWQRQIRCLRYVGMRARRSSGPGLVTKVQERFIAILGIVFGWFGMVVVLKSAHLALQENRTTQTNRGNVNPHKVKNDENLFEESLEDLLLKDYPDTDDESDATFIVDSSSDMESSAYQSLTDSDQAAALETRPRKQKLHPRFVMDTPAYSNAETPKSTASLKARKHVPNESSSGVESMDTRAPPPTAEHSISSAKSDEDDAIFQGSPVDNQRSEEVNAEPTNTKTREVSPLRMHTVIHRGTPETPTITLCDYDQNDEQNNSFMLNVSTILADTVTLRSIENTAETNSNTAFSEPEMSKSKRRRLKKKQQQNKEN